MRKFRLPFLALLLGLIFSLNISQASEFNDPAFGLTWNRVDKPVQDGVGVGRGYTWGPVVGGSENITSEIYEGVSRRVQYFDKARMEINNPAADPTSLYYVTTGLLVKELVTGQRQDGDFTFTLLSPSTIQIAGDPNTGGANAIAPTYASFKEVVTFNGSENGTPNAIGSLINSNLIKSGLVSTITPPETQLIGGYDSVTNHNIAAVFSQFGNQTGLVWNNGKLSQDSIFFGNPTYVLGRPVSEPYWLQAVVGGVQKDVLVQLFERRVLTYTPTNPTGFKVEMGNVGQHYYQWRYLQNSTAPQPTPTPPPTIPPVNPPEAANPQINSFSVGQPGFTDVVPHQIVRTSGDKLYIFAAEKQSQLLPNINLKAYWTTSTGIPTSTGQFAGSATVNVGVNLISVVPAYDGGNIVHVLVNLNGTSPNFGKLLIYPFNVSTNTFNSPITIVSSGNPAVSGDYIGSSGVSAMVDTGGTLHVAYWSSGNHIIYRAYSYNSGSNVYSSVSGPTQLDGSSDKSNHPSVAISPQDGSITVAWVSETSVPRQILAKARPANGNWSSLQTVSTSPVWFSTNFGINIDQGPSIVIDSSGVKHLTYIQNFDATGDYGKLHYVTNSGSGWVDNTLSIYTHDPALAINSSGELYILGHGHPKNPANTISQCRTGNASEKNMCVIKKNSDGTWTSSSLVLAATGNLNFDASPSVKWGVVGFNRPETIEFLFFSANNDSYNNTTIFYGNIAPTQANRTPTAAFTVNPNNGAVPLQVNFDGSASFDPDAGDTLTYLWNFGDGSSAQASTATTSHFYNSASTFTASLQVRDNKGATSGPVSKQITTTNTLVATILGPKSSDKFAVGSKITLLGQARYGVTPLPNSGYSWTVNLRNTGNNISTTIFGPTSGNPLTFTVPTPTSLNAAQTNYFEIQLIATNSNPVVSSPLITRTIQPWKVNLNFVSVPAGLTMKLETSTVITSPAMVVSLAGYQLAVDTTDPQNDASSNALDFKNWSDGGTKSHPITTPFGPATYVATFTRQDNTCIPVVVTKNNDDGTCGTLRNAITAAPANGNVIGTAMASLPATITLNNSGGLNLTGITLAGVCSPGGPGITVKISNTPLNVTLGSGSNLIGLFFPHTKITVSSGGNKLQCVKVTRVSTP